MKNKLFDYMARVASEGYVPQELYFYPSTGMLGFRPSDDSMPVGELIGNPATFYNKCHESNQSLLKKVRDGYYSDCI